jgi:hypothetical protein
LPAANDLGHKLRLLGRVEKKVASRIPALGLRGDLDEAKATLTEALKLKPEWNSLARLRATFSNWKCVSSVRSAP